MGQVELSPMAVTLQAIGMLLLAAMLAQLGRISGRAYAKRWALGWALYFLALTAVRIYIATLEPLTWLGYLMFQWAYLVLLWSGCRSLVRVREPDVQLLSYALPLGAAAAAVLIRLAPTFNDLFTVQAAIVAFVAGASYRTLGRMPAERRQQGWGTFRGALLTMALVYTAYVPLYAYNEHARKIPLLGYSSLADLLLCIVLGFGMILVTAEDTNSELRSALSELDEARVRVEQKMRTDPLTNALNRHAFYAMQRGEEIASEGLAGVVLMIDIDNLKQINDTEGHAVGDAVIRAAANAIRARIRADDLLFRWGGDEFVAVIPNLALEAVSERMASLREGLKVSVSSGRHLLFFLSWGGAEFSPARPLDDAMREADKRMYERRQGVSQA